MSDLMLAVTLWPSFPHFSRFVNDPRISSIRLNSAMIDSAELDQELGRLKGMDIQTPLFFDVKGRQLRVTEAIPNSDHLDIRINHPIRVKLPTPVLFKAGADSALLVELAEDGTRLIFDSGPANKVKAGESLHIRDASLYVGGPQFTSAELVKIDKVLQAGFRRFFLSYTECVNDADEFIKLVGEDAEVRLKIENNRGLSFVTEQFVKTPNVRLVAAQGDLYVEVDRPHDILNAIRLIIRADPQACVGSRLLLSIIQSPVPSCSDFEQLAWLYEIGYREMMLCDELCLKGELLERAVSVFDCFRGSYALR